LKREARRCDHVDELHGVRVPDPYRWLEDTRSDETRAWIEAQRGATESHVARLPHREAIRARLAELWSAQRRSVPVARRGRLFYEESDATRERAAILVQDADGERVLLDPATLSSDAAVVDWMPSPDGTLLAWARADAGSDWRTWRVRDVASGVDREDVVGRSKFSAVQWLRDSSGFAYESYASDATAATSARTGRQSILIHLIDTPQDEDELVFCADDPEIRAKPFIGDDGRVLVLRLIHARRPGDELHVRSLASPEAPMLPVFVGFESRHQVVAASEDALLLHVDENAPNWKCVRVDPRRGAEAAEIVIAEAEGCLRHVLLAGDRIIAVRLVDALPRISLHALDGAPLGDVPLPTPVSVEALRSEPGSSTVYFETQSFLQPPSIHRLDASTGEVAPWWSPRTRFDPGRFVTHCVTVAGRDGERIPVFLSHRRDLPERHGLPTYLYGYGGFDHAMLPRFGASTIAWMEMGGLHAQASIRGGGEKGSAWHRAAIREGRQLAFDDFIAVSEWLVSSGWTGRERLAIGGHSNGGLLVGACMTQRPELFAAALPGSGVLDMLRFHSFTAGWIWVSEYGCADDAADFLVLHAYSPLHRVRPGTKYPATLITVGEGDERVVPSHSYKFAAALQAAQRGDAIVLLRIEPRTGHGADASRSSLVAEYADRLAFLTDVLGAGAPDATRSAPAP